MAGIDTTHPKGNNLKVQKMSLAWGAKMPTRADFLSDRQGRRFSAVMGPLFDTILGFFGDPDRVRRMEEAELHHDRPALAGVIRELESQPDIARHFATTDGHLTVQLRQGIGVVVRMVMEARGWATTGTKSSLGQRPAIPPHTTTPGAYRNTAGLSRWITRSERYTRVGGLPYADHLTTWERDGGIAMA